MTRPAHIGTIERPEIEGASEIQAGRFRARCSCGWASPEFWQEDPAVKMLTDHLASLPPVEQDIKTIDEWLALALGPIREQIEQSENGEELVFIGARLTEIEQKISASFSEIRTLLNERLSYVTGRVKGQG